MAMLHLYQCQTWPQERHQELLRAAERHRLAAQVPRPSTRETLATTLVGLARRLAPSLGISIAHEAPAGASLAYRV